MSEQIDVFDGPFIRLIKLTFCKIPGQTLMCRYCFKSVNTTRKSLVTQHFTREQHNANKRRIDSNSMKQSNLDHFTAPESKEFNRELVTAFVAADISLYKLENPILKKLLGKHTISKMKISFLKI